MNLNFLFPLPSRKDPDIIPFFAGWGFDAPWALKKILFIKQSPQAVKKARREFSYQIKNDFYQNAIRSLGPWLSEEQKQALLGFDQHHVLPLGGGGWNSWLALVANDRHKRIHVFIDHQTQGLEIGESRPIWVPVYPGHVWGLRSLFENQALPPTLQQTLLAANYG